VDEAIAVPPEDVKNPDKIFVEFISRAKLFDGSMHASASSMVQPLRHVIGL
jgi:hypothetical protein